MGRYLVITQSLIGTLIESALWTMLPFHTCPNPLTKTLSGETFHPLLGSCHHYLPFGLPMIFRDAGIGNRGGVAIYFSRVDQSKRLTPPSILTECCKFSLEAEGMICQQEEILLCGEVPFSHVT